MNSLSPALAATVREMNALDRCVLLTDPNQPDNPIIYVSDGFLRHTGYTRDEVMGRNCRFLQGPATDPLVRAAVREAIAARRGIVVRILNYRKNGEAFLNVLRIRPAFDREGKLEALIGVQNPEPDGTELPQQVLRRG